MALRRLPTQLVVVQQELSLAHQGDHRDLPGGQLAEVLLALLPQLGVKRCVSAGCRDHLTGEPHRSGVRRPRAPAFVGKKRQRSHH